MVYLTGCLQHYTELPATVNLRGLLPHEYQLTAKLFNWTDLRKELNPETMQDEQLQISWLFIRFCIQEFSAGIDDLKQCFHE